MLSFKKSCNPLEPHTSTTAENANALIHSGLFPFIHTLMDSRALINYLTLNSTFFRPCGSFWAISPHWCTFFVIWSFRYSDAHLDILWNVQLTDLPIQNLITYRRPYMSVIAVFSPYHYRRTRSSIITNEYFLR